jgi:hypothetical protein
LSRPGRHGRPLRAAPAPGSKAHGVRPVCVPPQPAKDAGIRVLQGAGSRCLRQTVASLLTLQPERGPTLRLTAPLGPRLRRCQRLRAAASQQTAARCGRESNPLHPGFEPGALPLSYHTWSRPGSDSLHGTRPADRPETGPARRGPDETSACLKIVRCVPQGRAANVSFESENHSIAELLPAT